ncbi:carbohydrate kinase family protein [Glutamicibacter protophormiae]|uniref:carbohydrate kinase family protein n=1 Tax=Glutamicibacter protophormiae TaxID=37930 RepID=UPI001959F9B9|nr:carbohydrate kinase [Glutamicibacter protophormiae]QRQ78007.1 carbohydrate kinase [Glutamicibacter protophormiae]
MASIQVAGEALVDIVNGLAYPGGSPLNVAVGLGRLGHEVTLQTGIGGDEHGRAIIEHLHASDVRLAADSVTEAATSTATVTLDPSGQAAYDFKLDWKLESVVPTDAQVLHTGSIAAFTEPGFSQIHEVFANSPAHQLRSYDPNLRPALVDKRRAALTRIETLCALSHVVKLSDEDALWLYPGWDTARVLEHILARGAKLAVMTFGVRGCEARTDQLEVSVPSLQVSVADTVGAGDAFMSGLLHAISNGPLLQALVSNEKLDEDDVESALRTASLSAALTVQKIGANPPTLLELESCLSSVVF